ncbi:hypothetical protein ACZ75_17820 [Massilia sp. NR 4-1]|nr:hypothetical protein ACZ75_17820 [Massilia sp. NR 4-1]
MRWLVQILFWAGLEMTRCSVAKEMTILMERRGTMYIFTPEGMAATVSGSAAKKATEKTFYALTNRFLKMTFSLRVLVMICV